MAARYAWVWVGALCGCAAGPPPAASPPALPGLQDEFLDRLVGDWDLTGSVGTRAVRNSVTARWVLGHQFVRMEMTDVARPPTYEALVMVGYDAERKRYVAHWCDSF